MVKDNFPPPPNPRRAEAKKLPPNSAAAQARLQGAFLEEARRTAPADYDDPPGCVTVEMPFRFRKGK